METTKVMSIQKKIKELISADTRLAEVVLVYFKFKRIKNKH